MPVPMPDSPIAAQSFQRFIDAVQVLVLVLAPVAETEVGRESEACEQLLTAARRVLATSREVQISLEQLRHPPR
jgi:hypothetical protein